jgi:hypothetical protein
VVRPPWGFQELYRFFTDLTGRVGEKNIFSRFGSVRMGSGWPSSDGGVAMGAGASVADPRCWMRWRSAYLILVAGYWMLRWGRVAGFVMFHRHSCFLRAGGVWHWLLLLREYFKFGKTGRWKLFMGNGLRL